MKPKLRFKQFNSGWNTYKFYDLVTIKNGQVNPNDEQYRNLPHIGPGNIEKGTGRLLEYNLAKDDKLVSSKYLFDKESVIYGKINPHFAKVCYPKFIGLCSADAYPINPIKDKLTPEFLLYLLLNPKFTKFTTSVSMRTGMPKINRDELSIYKFTIPEIDEQKEIGNMLSLLDRKIELQTKKIEDLKLFKKGLFSDNIGDTKNIKLSDILTEVSIKSIINNQYEILSSTANGLYLQRDYFNKQAASENNIGYKILKRNQLVLSPQNLWMGNININDKYDIGIVSPSYKIFDIDDNIINIDFFNNWIKSPRALYDYMISSEQGASVVRRNLNIDLFNEITIKVPERNIQDKIGKQIKNINMKIELENRKLDKLNDLKKGLMQNMFV